MEHSWVESDSLWVVMVSIGASDNLGSEERKREEEEGT
jgi:hypothetical protein